MKLAARLLIVIGLAIFPVLLVVDWIGEFLAVDAALDRGASYDYERGKADFSMNHAYSPYSSRHSGLIACSLVSGGGLIILLVGWFKRLIRQRT